VSTFTKDQPKDGDTILHCGHVDQDVCCHWFKYSIPYLFERPNGTRGSSEWFAVCDSCFNKHGDKAPIRGDGKWIGDDPAIMDAEDN